MHTDNTSSLPFSYIKFGKGVYHAIQIEIVAGKRVAISVNGKVWLQLLCTPLDLDFLALGFLFNENIITTIMDIAAIKICYQASIVDIWTHAAVEPPELFTRTSGCIGGLTGLVQTEIVPFEVTEYIGPLTIFDCLRQLYLHQDNI